MNRVLVTGATGLVGSYLLRLLVDDPRIDEIIAPTRRALPVMNKVINPVEDDLTDVLQPLDGPLTTVFCCLGTTRKQAGSKAAFIHVDYTLVVDTALNGLRLGATQMLAVSAHGAHRHSPLLYSRVKVRWRIRCATRTGHAWFSSGHLYCSVKEKRNAAEKA